MSVFVWDPESNWPKRLVAGSNIAFRDTGAELIVDSAGGGGGGTVGGSGVAGRTARWVGTSTLGAGVLRDDGSNLLVTDGTEPAARIGLMQFVSDATAAPVYLDDYNINSGALGPVLHVRRARGTAAVPSDVSQADSLGILQWEGYHTGAFHAAAQIQVLVAVTPGSGDMPGNIRFLTSPDGSATPALRVAINHYGTVTLSQQAFSGVAPQKILLISTGTTLSNLTASAEVIDVDFAFGRTVERAAGAVTTQRSFVVRAPTFAFVSASTIDTAATIAIEAAPIAGANATITTPLALWVQAGNVTLAGGLNVGSATGAGAGQIITSGNVGIGRAPTQRLDVFSSGSLFVVIEGTQAGIDVGLSIKNNSGSGRQWALRADNSGNLLIRDDTAAAATFTFSTSALLPSGAGSLNLGDASNYWADISYKTLTDRGCLGWFDTDVEMPDGSLVSDTEALIRIRPHPVLTTPYGVPRFDYASMPKAVYSPAPIAERDTYETILNADGKTEIVLRWHKGDKMGDDGAETTALISIMIGAIRQLTSRVQQLEAR